MLFDIREESKNTWLSPPSPTFTSRFLPKAPRHFLPLAFWLMTRFRESNHSLSYLHIRLVHFSIPRTLSFSPHFFHISMIARSNSEIFCAVNKQTCNNDNDLVTGKKHEVKCACVKKGETIKLFFRSKGYLNILKESKLPMVMKHVSSSRVSILQSF